MISLLTQAIVFGALVKRAKMRYIEVMVSVALVGAKMTSFLVMRPNMEFLT